MRGSSGKADEEGVDSCKDFSRKMVLRREEHAGGRISAKHALASSKHKLRSFLTQFIPQVLVLVNLNPVVLQYPQLLVGVAAERPGFLAQTPKPDPGKENDRGGGVALQRAIIEWDNYLFDTASSMLQELYSKTKEQVVAVGMKWTAAEEEAEAGSANGSASSSSIKRKHPDGRKRWEQQSKVEKHQGANDEDFIPAENEFLDEQEDEDASKSQSSAVEKKKKKKFLDEIKSQAEAQQRGTTGLGQHEDPKRRSSRAGGGRGGKNDFLGEEEEPDFDSKPGTGSSSGLQKNNAVPHLPLGEQGRTRREGPPPPEDKLAAGATTSSDQVPAHEVAPVRDETDEQNGDSAAQSALQVKTGAKACDEVKNQDENKPESSALQNMKDEIKTSKSTIFPQQAAVVTPRPGAGAGRGGGGAKAETSSTGDDVHQPLSTGGGKNGGEQEVRLQQKQIQTNTTSAIPAVVFPSTSTASPSAREDLWDHHPQGRRGATAVNETRTSNNANDVDAVSELEQGQGHLPGKKVVNTTRISVFLVSSSTTTTAGPLTTTTAPFQDSLLDAPSIAEPPMALPSGESAGSDHGRATSTALVVWTPSPKMSTTSTSTSTWSSSSSITMLRAAPVEGATKEWAMEQLKAALMSSDDNVAGRKMAPGQQQEHEPAEEFLQLKLAPALADAIDVGAAPAASATGEGTTTGSKKYDVFVLSANKNIVNPFAPPPELDFQLHRLMLSAVDATKIATEEKEKLKEALLKQPDGEEKSSAEEKTDPRLRKESKNWVQLEIPNSAKDEDPQPHPLLRLTGVDTSGSDLLHSALDAARKLEWDLNKLEDKSTEGDGDGSSSRWNWMLCDYALSDTDSGGRREERSCLHSSGVVDGLPTSRKNPCRAILTHRPTGKTCEPLFFLREVKSGSEESSYSFRFRQDPLMLFVPYHGATPRAPHTTGDDYALIARELTKQARAVLAEQSLVRQGFTFLKSAMTTVWHSFATVISHLTTFLSLLAGGLSGWTAVFGVASIVLGALNHGLGSLFAQRKAGFLSNKLPPPARFAVNWAADRGWGWEKNLPHGKFLRWLIGEKLVDFVGPATHLNTLVSIDCKRVIWVWKLADMCNGGFT